jgi:hypothetical protein
MTSDLQRLLDLLDAAVSESVGTSVRLPVNLRDAAAVATELGMAASTTELTVRGLRDALEAFAQRAVLDAHYREHPHVRPALAEIALAAAELDGSPLAGRPDLVRRAAAEIVTIKDDPSADDVLLYAAGLASAA